MDASLIIHHEDATVRDEGNAAHWLAQTLFNTSARADDFLNTKAPNGVLITAEMLQHVSDYFDEILVRPDAPYGEMERDLSHGLDGVYRIGSRPDHFVFHQDASALYINDFKYGYRIVEPEWNWTLISHAIGFVRTTGLLPANVIFTIHQPRGSHFDGPVRSWSITGAQLHELIRSLDQTLSNLTDTLQTGPLCAKCPALNDCPAANSARMNSIDISTLRFNDEVSDSRLAYELDLLTQAKNVIEAGIDARSELAKHRLSQGKIIPNYHMDNQLTNRQWKKGVTPELMAVITGKNLSKPSKMVTPAEAIRQGVSETIIKAFCERVSTGRKLVREDVQKRAKRLLQKGK
jgi:hypothetical protein